MITLQDFTRIVGRLLQDGWGSDIEWAESCKMPENPDVFAREAIFVICNSGMKNTVARRIYERVIAVKELGEPASSAFGHKGKCAAIDKIWVERRMYLDRLRFHAERGDADMLMFIGTLPWIGDITKYHLAKNFGAQVAKPDVHLQRLADRECCTAQQLCERLASESGEKIATVDVLLWRACATGVINSKTGEIFA